MIGIPFKPAAVAAVLGSNMAARHAGNLLPIWLDHCMSELIGHGRRWRVAMAVLVATSSIGCSEDEGTKPETATETNVAPAPCESDEDCPLRCVRFSGEGGSGDGFCEPVPSEDEPPNPDR